MTLARPATNALAARLFGPPERALLLLRAAWPHAVGPELARRTELIGLAAGTLRVRVPDARWRQVLHRMRFTILARLRKQAGGLAPERLGFSEGPLPETAPWPAPPPPLAPLPADAPDSVAREAAAIADPELRQGFLESASRYLAATAKKAGR